MHATIFILSDESEELSTGCWAFASCCLPQYIHFWGEGKNIITDSLEFKIPKEREREWRWWGFAEVPWGEAVSL